MVDGKWDTEKGNEKKLCCFKAKGFMLTKRMDWVEMTFYALADPFFFLETEKWFLIVCRELRFLWTWSWGFDFVIQIHRWMLLQAIPGNCFTLIITVVIIISGSAMLILFCCKSGNCFSKPFVWLIRKWCKSYIASAAMCPGIQKFHWCWVKEALVFVCFE